MLCPAGHATKRNRQKTQDRRRLELYGPQCWKAGWRKALSYQERSEGGRT
jgi:hypothetical protein